MLLQTIDTFQLTTSQYTLLIINRWPAFALALLFPVTVIIIWFQIYFNPLPVPVATVVVAVVCELLLPRAYAPCYAGMFERIP